MKILFVSAVFPYPLYSGGQVRVYQLLHALSKNHQITLLTFLRDDEQRQYAEKLSFCANIVSVYRGRAWRPSYLVRAITSSYPFVMATYDLEEMRKKVTELTRQQKFDLVHIEPGYVYPALPETTLPLVVSEHNIEHEVYQGYVDGLGIPLVRPFFQLDVLKLARWERKIWEKATAITAVSEEDADRIKKSTTRPVYIVPNGVDEKIFRFRPKKMLTLSPQCLFVGHFRWVQNRDAVSFLLVELWPRLLERFPRATLRIVGRDFPKALRQYCIPSIDICEHVEDITEEYYRADLLLAPIRIGGGTKFKILEAMATGLPVITTKKGIEGIVAEVNKSYFQAEGVDEWVEMVTYLIGHPEHVVTVTKRARKQIETSYTWGKIASSLERTWMESSV